MTKHTLLYIGAVAAATLSVFSSCIKDQLYHTPHPHHGTIAVTTDWSNRTEGVAAPSHYTVAMGDYTAQAAEAVHAADYLFSPGAYCLAVYNAAEGVSVSGTTVSLSADPGRTDAGAYVTAAPGWLFTHAQDVTIAPDRTYALAAPMRQQMRQLTLVVTPEGDAAARVESIEGSLSGVASTLDFATDIHGGPSDVALSFARITSGPSVGKWGVTVRLLGTAGAQQKLTAVLRLSGSPAQEITLESDLTEALDGFNADKTVPLTLDGAIPEVPDAAVGFHATITDWTPGEVGNVELH